MIRKFWGSIWNNEAKSRDAFQVSKALSDYVGMFMRLAFLALLDRLMWIMYGAGEFGNPDELFPTFIIYVASGLLWLIFGASIISIFNLTYRCVVEIFDEMTGFSGHKSGHFWLLALLTRIGLGVVIGFYGVFTVIAVSVATQNIVKHLGP